MSEFEKGTRFWPRLLTAYCEDRQEEGALRFAIKVYAKIAAIRSNAYVADCVKEIERSYLGETRAENLPPPHIRSRQIWDDLRDRSIEKRGITRLFGALGHLEDSNLHDYEMEISRSLSMVAVDDNGEPEESGFREVVNAFLEEYPG